MSVPELRRKRNIAVAALAAAGLAVIAAVTLAASTPVVVKAGPRNEIAPSAGDDWFAWSQSRANRATVFDLLAQQSGHSAFRVNPKGTRAIAGGIDGATLVYQLLRTGRSDLRLFDLAARRQLPIPAGINTTKRECCASTSGGWILFSRGRQMVLLRNLTSSQVRVLDALSNPKWLVKAGQLNGNFTVWTRCNPRCQIFRYDLATASATALPVVPGKIVHSPSVNEYGTAYYALGSGGCGKSVQLVKQPVDGGSEVIASLPPGRDIGATYAHHVIPSPPGRIRKTRVYYDVVRCKPRKWDIYSVDDTESVPPP
jgi:hypothetical protein